MKANALPRTLYSICSHDSAHLTNALDLDSIGARIEVQCLLQKILNVSHAYLLAYPERCLTDSELDCYEALLQRRLQGEPIAYILGEREFFGLMFNVTPATLIPRADTELLVEQALQHIPLREHYDVLDLGTGSGAIALSIAHSRPKIKIVAVDASAEALIIAYKNAQRLCISNTTFIQSDWFSELNTQRFNLIVSNPPYIASEDPHLKMGDLRFEPASALSSGEDGLNDIRTILTQATDYLLSDGWLLLEHGYNQAAQVRELMKQMRFKQVFSACDLAGIERVTGGCI